VFIVDPGGGRRLAALPLAVAAALHLLLASLLIAATGYRPAVDAARRVVSVFVRVPPPALRPAPEPRRAAVRTSVAPRSAPLPITPVPPAESQAVPPIQEDPLAAPQPQAADDVLTRAKRQAGAIDRELRSGKSGVAMGASSRFAQAVSGAYVDRARTTAAEIRTSPDGEVTYRFRQGDKVWCRKSGSVAPDRPGLTEGAKLAGLGNAGSATTAGIVACPSDRSGWERR
jgi:hypothetical protein